MGRIFISAGHGGIEDGQQDLGVMIGGTTEAIEMIKLRDLIIPDLRSRGFEILSVPDDLSLYQTIDWINLRYRTNDVAIELHAEAFGSPYARGASAFYIANNEERKANADLILLALMRRVPNLPSRGTQPDTAAGVGRLAFCRNVIPPSVLLEVAHLANLEDRELLQTRRRDFAQGIADGLAAWSRQIGGDPDRDSDTPLAAVHRALQEIGIQINGQPYGEQGLLVNGNAYVPVDLTDSFGIDLSQDLRIRRISYRGVVYVKAVDLRRFNVSVGWDNNARSVVLKTILKICPGQLDLIMRHGNTSEIQLMTFLKASNPTAVSQFSELPKLYREEGSIEGVNYDIAFCQMCLETNFLRFGGEVKAQQNNFAGLGSLTGGLEGASFPSPRVGVRAQIQHLKAYASVEPILQRIVDPRYSFVTRGVAPLVKQLSGRWAADPRYGEKIMALVRRLYEVAELF